MGITSVEATISDPRALVGAKLGESVGSCYAVLVGTDRAGGVVQAFPDVNKCPKCMFRYSCSASLSKDSEQNKRGNSIKIIKIKRLI